MHGALSWCIHGWAVFFFRSGRLVDPSQIVAFCSSVFVL